jgi:hypothetical protein
MASNLHISVLVCSTHQTQIAGIWKLLEKCVHLLPCRKQWQYYSGIINTNVPRFYRNSNRTVYWQSDSWSIKSLLEARRWRMWEKRALHINLPTPEHIVKTHHHQKVRRFHKSYTVIPEPRCCKRPAWTGTPPPLEIKPETNVKINRKH